MYLSDRDARFAISSGLLIFKPEPTEIDTTSIDLHLDHIDKAKVWDVATYVARQTQLGEPPLLGVGKFDYRVFAREFAVAVPTRQAAPDARVYRKGDWIILRPGGFFLWQTKESVGTPEEEPRLICFVNGKSTRARTGLVVHMTAPTIHAGWWGHVTLELSNLGPFDLALQEGDPIAQIVVAALSSPPLGKKISAGIAIGQQHVTGTGSHPPAKRKRGKGRS